MNKRINELATLATRYAIDKNPEQDSYGRAANPIKFQQDRDNKFAKLIVQECAKIAGEMRHVYVHQAELTASTIKEHFGVEE
jgi:hypothetical protein